MKEQIFMSLLEFVHKENLYSMCIRKKKAYYFFRGNSFSWHWDLINVWNLTQVRKWHDK